MVATAQRAPLPLLRGSAEGARCHECPFANADGRPARPVFSEHPEKPSWILVGEGPGTTEVNLGRPFVGPSGELVNKMLGRVGKPRGEIFVGNATLCIPPRGSPDTQRDQAARACKPRLQRELAQWPSIPVLTLGAVAARALIPQKTLDAIDPPSVPKSKKRSQKERQRAEAKLLARETRLRVKAIDKIAKRRLKELLKIRHAQLIEQCMRPLPSAPWQKRKRPTRKLLDQLIIEQRELPRLKGKARQDAIAEYQLGAKERELQAQYEAANPKPKKPPKPKKVKITDIMGSCFTVDIDGSGPRPLIPTIHPAALLRGGGATIGGTHTPDLAFINLIYDAGKVNALGAGRNIHLALNVETEVHDGERTWQLLRDVLLEAIVEGELAIDLETYVEDPERHHALMAYKAQIRALGLATSKRAVSLLWELIPSWMHSYLQVVLSHPSVIKTFHNCLTEDSRVWLADGRRVRIGQLVRDRYQGKVWTLNEHTGEIEAKTVVDWIKGPVRAWSDWLRIRVKGKGCLRLTCDHQVLTHRGRVRADQVAIGDRIFTTHAALSSAQRSLIYGSLLGDASIYLAKNRPRKLGRRRSPFFRVGHDATTQADYAKFKADVLGGLVSSVATVANNRGFSRSDGKLVSVTTHGDPRLHEVWTNCTRKSTKTLTNAWLRQLDDRALAVWYCDDGQLAGGTSAALCVTGLGLARARRLTRFLRVVKKWPARLEVRKQDGNLYIRVTGPRGRGLHPSMDQFWCSIAPHVPSCMARKLPTRYRHLIDDRVWVERSSLAWADEVVEVSPLLRQPGARGRYRGVRVRPNTRNGLAQYCLVVAGNRNFFAEGLAVSNCLYDTTVLRANGFSVEGPLEDTMLAHHAAFPGCAHRLQVVVSQFFATQPWKSEFRNAEETPEGLTAYNAKDVGGTRAVRAQLSILVRKTNTEKIYELDRKMAEIASRMHLAGMPVDREINSELLGTFTKNVVESRRAVEAVAADPKLREGLLHHLALQQALTRRKNDHEDLNVRYEQRLEEIHLDTKWKWKIGAGKHIAALIQALGVQLHQVTASGQISTKKDILESLVHVPIVRDILSFRENDKLLSTFIWQIFDRFDASGTLIQHGYADEDDRIHPIWSVHKISGRWASSEPVVSNVPKDKFKKMPDGTKKLLRPNLRRQISPTRPGRILVGFDFSQIEARVIALVSGDPFLCSVFAEGKDIHRECARVVFPSFDTLDKDSQKKARDETKNFEYGAFYGGAPETLHQTLLKQGHNFKLADVAKAQALLMRRMSGVVQWQRDCVARAMKPPYEVRDFLLGRRRTFPLGQVEATEAMNSEVQPSAAAIMNTGMARMDAALRDSDLKEVDAIAQIHDACVFECWEDDAAKVSELIDRNYTQSYERDGRTIPFPVETKIGRSWADV